MQRKYYLNPSIKKIGIPEQYTSEQLQEYIKCSKDPVYFIENYVYIKSLDKGLVKFKLRGYQLDLINSYHDNNKNIVLSSRQSGKSITTAAYILWYVLFNSDKGVALLANKASLAREILSRILLMLENIPFFLQPGVKTLNKGSIEFGNNSTIMAAATSPSSIRGFSINFLYCDEFAHVDQADEFFESVFPTISSGFTSKIIISSTPKGLNLFHKLWKDAQEGRSDFTPSEITYDKVPGRDQTWKAKQVEIMGEQGFRQEYGNEFIGSSDTLIAGYKLQELTWETPIKSDANYTILKEPMEDRTYIAMVDVSKGVKGDYSTVTIIDITTVPYKIAYTFRDNTIRPINLPGIINSICKRYNDCPVAVERNSMGQSVADSLFYDFDYENVFSTGNSGRKGQILSIGSGNGYTAGIEMTKSVKRIGCANLKAMIEENKLTGFTSEQVSELYSFISKRDSYEADANKKDDLVMNLVMFAWLVQQDYFKELTDKNFSEMFNGQEEKEYDVLGFACSVANTEEDSWILR